MKTGNYFLDSADLVLTFDRLVPWERLVPLVEPEADVAETVSTWREVLALGGRYVGMEVAARAPQVDEIGVVRADGRIELSEPLKQNLKGLAELGLVGLSIPPRYGGAGLPFTASAMFIEMLARACPSTMVQYAFYTAPAAMILRFGTDEQKERYVPRLARGEIIGAVAMSEPQAGSDVGNLATAATPVEDGCWLLRGRKQFITSGNGDFVIVLARCVPGSRGLDGLGLFIAERAGDNYAVERAEHKFTIRGSPTCALSFDGTRAEILGPPGDGWREILSFMNESRVGVGIQGLGIAQAALEAARDYAAQRVQMGRPIREHPMVAEMLLDMETTVAGLRALALEAAVRQDIVSATRDEKEAGRPGSSGGPARASGASPSGFASPSPGRPSAERAARELRELTPLVKWYGSEEVIRIARTALQIHGGYGVVDEYDVGRFLRDSIILAIYEGTSQIQSLMAVKDLMKAVLRDPASLVGRGPSPLLGRASYDGRVGRDFAAARGLFVGAVRGLLAALAVRAARRGALVARLSRALGLARDAESRSELGDEELGPFLLHAERLTETLAHLHVARALAEQAQKVPEREPLAARAARRARLVAERNARAIESGDGGVFARIADWRAERKS